MVSYKPPNLPDRGDCESFRKVLRELRKQKGYKQAVLAKKLYIATSKITELECKPLLPSFGIKDVSAFAEALECTQEEYFRLLAAYLCDSWYGE